MGPLPGKSFGEIKMKIDNIPTPAVIIDNQILQHNIKTMSDICNKHKITLRPHIKTHNIPELAGQQTKNHAFGVTVATLKECKIMIENGIKDIFIAREMTDPIVFQELAGQMKKANISIGVDSPEGAKIASKIMIKKKLELDVLIEVDTGGNRCGLVSTKDITALAQQIDKLPGINFKGIFTHEGHVYSSKTKLEIKIKTQKAIDKMSGIAAALEKQGFQNLIISIGSTPSVKYADDFKKVNEIRPGNYIFNDAMQVANGSALSSDCALKVIASVISKSGNNRAVLNAGSKLMGSDRGKNISDAGGYSLVIEPEKHVISRVYEEHSVIESRNSLKIGQKVTLIPGHACMTANLANEIYLIDHRSNIIKKWKSKKYV